MQENNNQNPEIELDENRLIQIRKEKLKELQEQGKNPFEITKYDRTNSAGEIKANYEAFEQKDVKELQEQLQKVLITLKTLEDVTIKSKDREIYQIEQVELVVASKRLKEAQSILNATGVVDVSSFEGSNPEIFGFNYDNSEERQKSFQSNIKQQED